MAMQLDDTEELGSEAPRPIHADSVANGTFERLGSGQGAKAARHGARHASTQKAAEVTPFNRKFMTALIIGAVVVVLLIVVVLVRLLGPANTGESSQAQVEQVEVAVDETITYRGASYALIETVGGMALGESREGAYGQYTSLGDIPGAPVSLILFDATLVIPENLSDGTWDVLAYTIGSGWSQIMDQQGNVQSGKGAISAATLDGSTLRLVVDGNNVEVPLKW